jgi:signal transduction histidine kinase
MDVVYRPTRLSTLTADLVSLFRSAIELGSIQLVVDTMPDLPIGSATSIYLSDELWEKIIFNIVGNAFKYTSKGSISVTVRYTTTEALVEIADTGCE